ncbi:DUF3203 family protein [Pseudomonas sp. BN417]|nr:DUF3203 family protein [Pseudomonas sp. BN417]
MPVGRRRSNGRRFREGAAPFLPTGAMESGPCGPAFRAAIGQTCRVGEDANHADAACRARFDPASMPPERRCRYRAARSLACQPKESAMAVNIDLERGICTLELDGKLIELPIQQVVIATDQQIHVPVIRCVDGNFWISEDQALMLIGVGARDERST